jgi:hypothetical protein
MSDRSFQELDPVGGYSLRPVTILLTVLSFAYSVGATVVTWQPGTVAVLAGLAVVVNLVASLGCVYWSSPLRAPFPMVGYLWVVSGTCTAMVIAALSAWGRKTDLDLEWGSIAIGLAVVQLCAYRPARQLIAATVFGEILTCVLVVVRPAFLDGSVNPYSTLLHVSVPLCSIGFGGAVYALTLQREVVRPSASRPQSAVENAQWRRENLGAAPGGQSEMVTNMVIPFLASLRASELVAETDRGRASEIAQSMRASMVADMGRTWLDNTVIQVMSYRDAVIQVRDDAVSDPDRLAEAMSTSQRTATRSLLIALFTHEGFDPAAVAITIRRRGRECEFSLHTRLEYEHPLHDEILAPYIAVMRIVFRSLELSAQPPTLALRFWYEHR